MEWISNFESTSIDIDLLQAGALGIEPDGVIAWSNLSLKFIWNIEIAPLELAMDIWIKFR